MTRLDRLDAAEARFRESLACDPRFALAHYQLGLTLEKKGRVAEAVAELEEAARLDPASPEAQYALARVYRRAGDEEKADRALQRFEQIKKEADAKKGRGGPGTAIGSDLDEDLLPVHPVEDPPEHEQDGDALEHRLEGRPEQEERRASRGGCSRLSDTKCSIVQLIT